MKEEGNTPQETEDASSDGDRVDDALRLVIEALSQGSLTMEQCSEIVEGLVSNGETYMDSVIHVCSEYGIDLEDASDIISPSIKSKLREEAIALNLMKGVKSDSSHIC